MRRPGGSSNGGSALETRPLPGAEPTTEGVVLLVDDSSVIRSVVHRRLEEQGYRVVDVADGGGALAAFRECRPDVVLLDIEMPGLDGLQIIEVIRAETDQADTPVVFLTARDKTEDVVEALRLGAHDYLCTPFEPSELIARVRAAVRVKSLQDELRVRNAELEALYAAKEAGRDRTEQAT
jgi:two-component system cell cycle response regulator